jgi:AP-4 complex subunit beta-1
MKNTTPTPTPTNAPKFFVDYKKGEVVELMNLMKNPKTNSDPNKKKDVIKRVIAYMTLGVDVSKLFFEMVKASITEDIVLKKMVFLYIVNYADQIEQGAILAINTFLKDIKNQNPKIRGLALRSLCSLKFKGSYEYFSNAMYDSLKDSHPYVRKTAVVALLKVYHLNPKLITNRDIDTLYEMVGDRDPLVVMNVLFVLGEILKKQGGIHLTMKMVNHLLNMFNELNEWGQCAVLDLIAKYHPKEQKQIFDIMNLLEEYLRHSSSAIVIGVTKVFINLTKDNDVLYPQVIKRLRDPMITLLSGCEMSNSFEMAYSILSHIYFLILKGGRVVFSEIYKKFFVKFEEPLYLKKLKLEILIQISTDINYQDILNEMEEYVNDFSIIFAKDAIKKIGELGLRVDSSLKSIVTVLKGLLNRNTDFIVSETLCVIRELSRKYPAVFDEFANMLESSIITLNNETRGLSALLWLIGEFGDKIEHSSYIVDYLSKLEIQSTEFAYALLLASCKLFFKNPGEMQPILGKVFENILKNYQDVDLRDRTQYYYNLMKNDINMAEYVICGEPTIVDYFYSDFDEEYVDEIYAQFNSLSIIYRKPEEKFTKYTAMDDDDAKKDEDDEQQQQDVNAVDNNDNTNTNGDDLIHVEQNNTLHSNEAAMNITIGTVSEDTLTNPYSIDENTYQNLWAQYNTYVTEHAKMIEDEVELAGYVEYLNSKGIFTKAYGTNNGVSTMFLFSNEKNTNAIFLVKLTLNHTSYQIDYELKAINEQCAKEYNKYLYENISPLIDQ